MIVYRLSNKKYGKDLSGTGAAITGGRWNKKGRPVVYTSETIALALLEVVVNIPPMFQPDFMLFSMEIPDKYIFEIPLANLPSNWFHYPAPSKLSAIAEEYYRKEEILVLKVPSAVIKNNCNYLINPRSIHANKVKSLSFEPFIFDPRLYKKF